MQTKDGTIEIFGRVAFRDGKMTRLGFVLFGAGGLAVLAACGDGQPLPAGNTAVGQAARLNRGFLPGLPQEVADSIAKAENARKISSVHGTSAWTVLARDQLIQLGLTDEAEAATGIRSFKSLLDSGAQYTVFNRNRIRTEKWTSNKGGFDDLWVGVDNLNAPGPAGNHYLTASRYAEKIADVRAYDVNTAELRIREQISLRVQLEALVSSGSATVADRELLESTRSELEFNTSRLGLFDRLGSQNKKFILESLKTPVILEWHADPTELSLKSNQTTNSAVVRSAFMPYQSLETAYIDAGASEELEQEINNSLKRFGSSAKIVRVGIAKSSEPIPLWQNLSGNLGKIMDVADTYLPLVGAIAIVSTPMGLSVIDFNDSMSEYDVAVERGQTNMTASEWYSSHSQLRWMLEDAGFGMFASGERSPADSAWAITNMPLGVKNHLQLVIPDDRDVVEKIGTSQVLDVTTGIYRVNKVAGNQKVFEGDVTYLGDGINGPRIMIESNGGTLELELGQPINGDLGPNIWDCFGVVDDASGKVLQNSFATVAFPLRYTRFGQSMELWTRPIVVESASCQK